jgi:quercetin dioxygenase-like cupin family protein
MPETIADRPDREVRILLDSPALTVTYTRFAAGQAGADLHVHREHTDAFAVVSGVLTVRLGPAGDPLRLEAGSFVAIPPGVVHGFANDGPGEGAWLNLHAPDAGFAAYLRGLRDGERPPFDQFEPPADGGRPVSDAVIHRP